MKIDVEDRIVVVTGAAMGFGRSIAQNFAAPGAQVFGSDLSSFVTGQVLPVNGGSL